MKLKELLVESQTITKIVKEFAIKKVETQGQGIRYQQYADVELSTQDKDGKPMHAMAFRLTDEEGKSGEYSVTSSTAVGTAKYIKTKYSYYERISK